MCVHCCLTSLAACPCNCITSVMFHLDTSAYDTHLYTVHMQYIHMTEFYGPYGTHVCLWLEYGTIRYIHNIHVTHQCTHHAAVCTVGTCIINPRRACAARVTVVVLCVCLSVCLSVCLLLFSHHGLRGGL